MPCVGEEKPFFELIKPRAISLKRIGCKFLLFHSLENSFLCLISFGPLNIFVEICFEFMQIS